jgi:hypothetical protein
MMLLQVNVAVSCYCRLMFLCDVIAALCYCVMLLQVDITVCKVRLKSQRHEKHDT